MSPRGRPCPHSTQCALVRVQVRWVSKLNSPMAGVLGLWPASHRPPNPTTLAEPTSTPYDGKSSEESGNNKVLPAAWGWGGEQHQARVETMPGEPAPPRKRWNRGVLGLPDPGQSHHKGVFSVKLPPLILLVCILYVLHFILFIAPNTFLFGRKLFSSQTLCIFI